MGKDGRFNTYRKISGKWTDIKPVMQGLLLTAIIAFLFYKSVFGLFAGIVIIPFWVRMKKAEDKALARSKVAMEFKEYMMLIVAGLQAGYSLERAVRQAEDELIRLFPEGSRLAIHIHRMNQKLAMNIQLEKAFDEFAKDISLEEAMSLAEIISFAKRSGGDYGRHIKETALKIEDNLSIKQEIETITTEKRLELKVMCVMPLGILAYITITSADFIAPLYGNALGVLVMTACLIGYGACIILGKKIIDINV